MRSLDLSRALLRGGTAVGIGLCASWAGPVHAAANDHFFPAAPSARQAIEADARGFVIEGKRTFLVSAGVEYARIPRALWRDRLLRLKRAGFNCVEVYTFWNWHEPKDGRFLFTADHDLNAFLRLVREMGMYAIPRVGPYYCAEWDSGGYPLWLRFKPGVRVREHNAQFEKYVDRFFDHLLPIVVNNQVSRGGAVVLVQLENEHPDGWGTENLNNPYFRHIREKALSLGLEVPYFFSGVHHSSDPVGNTAVLDSASRPNPWFSTEFWSVWYDRYSSGEREAAEYDRRTWKIISRGGGGYNYYMAHGGTNFAYTNNNEDAACYDYGAAVGQTGDLRPVYYRFKRAGWFARSFAEVLENATDASAAHAGLAANPAVHVTARRSPAGTIAFLDNPGSAPAQTALRDVSGEPLTLSPVTLAPGEIMPVLLNVAVAPGIRLERGAVRTLGMFRQGGVTTLVVYGPAGSSTELVFRAGGKRSVVPVAFRDGAPSLIPGATSGSERVRILAVSEGGVDHTWWVDAGTSGYLVYGPSLAGEARLERGRLRLTTERQWSAGGTSPVLAYGEGDTPLRLTSEKVTGERASRLPLTAWSWREAAAPAAARFDDHSWLRGENAPSMGADGDGSADAWYRATVHVPEAGAYTLHADGGGDRALAFVDGQPSGGGPFRSGEMELRLPTGTHTLALFMAHDGRDKLFNHLGPIDTVDAKGLRGVVTLRKGGLPTLANWRVHPAPGGARTAPPSADAAGWRPYTVGADAFNKRRGFAWFQSTLALPAGFTSATLHFRSVDDNATVFINGREVARHEGWNDPFDVPVTAAAGGAPVTVSVLVENTDNTGGLGGPVTVVLLGSGVRVTGWRLRGGPGNPDAVDGWKSLSGSLAADRPRFYRSHFTWQPPAESGPRPMWRVVTQGLGHGSVWVNGHNLGRYPETVPVNGLYVPECWLRRGENTLVIFDEDGKGPNAVAVEAETAASRDVIRYSEEAPSPRK